MRLVKVITVTYVPAYTPQNYLDLNALRSMSDDFSPSSEPELPATIEDCVSLEQKLLNDPDSSDLSLGLYTETEVVNPQIVLELMPEGFTVPDGFARKMYNGIYLDQMERLPV